MRMSDEEVRKKCLEIHKCDDVEKLRNIAINLWDLLDDVDTASDIFKPNNPKSYKAYYNHINGKISKRFLSMVTDGFELYLPYESRNPQKRDKQSDPVRQRN